MFWIQALRIRVVQTALMELVLNPFGVWVCCSGGQKFLSLWLRITSPHPLICNHQSLSSNLESPIPILWFGITNPCPLICNHQSLSFWFRSDFGVPIPCPSSYMYVHVCSPYLHVWGIIIRTVSIWNCYSIPTSNIFYYNLKSDTQYWYQYLENLNFHELNN